jgi:osmotically-inducible protein OsmY
MKLDAEIKFDVEAELRWAPEVDETALAVKVSDGVVTLLGWTRNSFERYRAEQAARRVKGVAAVANEILVRPPGSRPRDAEIAQTAVAALKADLPEAYENIEPVVQDGHVTLLGRVEWHYQRQLAELLVHRINGVLGVRNSIEIKPKAAMGNNIKQQIQAAFKRLAQVDASRISVEAEGSEIALRGEVRSWAEHDQAQATAWSAPGVTNVRNELTVRS